jgi:hypothetical protein
MPHTPHHKTISTAIEGRLVSCALAFALLFLLLP